MEKLMEVKNVIVWDKKVHGLGSDYKSTYELCVVGKKGKPDIQNRFGLDYQDIWRLQREMGRNKDHATAKPIELLEKPIKHASKADDIVLDLFLGSGSTLIAAQKTGRICYGMELDPKYVDVIVQRYVDYTGNNIIKLNGKEITWQK
jgi:DNA modification methylase